MTIEQAIAEETRRYVDACREARRARRKAHIRRLALQRLRHSVISPHEAFLFQHPSVHAHGAGK